MKSVKHLNQYASLVEAIEIDYLEEKNELEQTFEDIMKTSRYSYWRILEAKKTNQLDTLDPNYIGVLETAVEYISLVQRELGKNGLNQIFGATFDDSPHMMIKTPRKEGSYMDKVAAASAAPLINLDELKQAWSNLIELHTLKVFFVFIGTVLSLLLGDFTTIKWVLFIMTILHSVLRLVANNHKGKNDYIRTSRNIILFFWPYFLLAIANALSLIIAFNGLPEGTFLALCVCFLIHAEIRGIVDNAKVAKLPVPGWLEKIAYPNRSNDVSPPL